MKPQFLLFALAIYAQSFSGGFQNKELRIELREAAGGSYTGTIHFQGQDFPVTARVLNGQLSGSFQAGQDPFPFTATVSGATMRLASGGTEYVLAKETVTANPLAAATAGFVTHQHAMGYSIQAPRGWTFDDNAEGIVMLPPGVRFDPSQANNPEVYIATVKDGYTPAEEAQFVQQLGASFQQNGAARREAAAFGARAGSIYRWDVRNPQNGQNVALDLYVAPEGQRVYVVVAAGNRDLVRSRDITVRQILSSVSYTAPKVEAGGALADSSALAQQWLNKLRGRMIRQMHVYSGMSSDKYHYINADGTYVYRSRSMVSVTVPGASGMSSGGSNERGRWKIRDIGGRVFLQVQYQNGETAAMPITQDARNWYLNGEKAFAVDPE
jgi:hypothetical protein